ncbi:MAG: hypothetical protein K8U57_31090 [Planctomycetes bacterium]|nr:hypothetical protein [Planctomycetota bacterium]
MATKQRSFLGYVGAGFFGAALTAALGATDPQKTVYPRYNAYNHGPFLHITDNDTNKQYIYLNDNEASKLLGYVDLNQTGKPELKAVKAEKN